MATVLIVDDAKTQRDSLKRFLIKQGWNVLLAPDGVEAVERISEFKPDAVVMDVRMPRCDGRTALQRLGELAPALPVIMMTAFGDIRDAVDAVKQGAVDYLTKPVDLHELLALLEGVVRPRLHQRSGDAATFGELPEWVVAQSPDWRRTLSDVALVAPTDASVLITGESGTGKEVVAELVHRWSDRASGPLVRVNIAAIPATLLEREIFGHVRGAFTGATESSGGHLAAASGGTLFLDEIGDMPGDLQPRLLRALETKEFYPLGASAPKHSNFRLVVATNSDLEAAVAQGKFREDLYYRINVFRVRVAPLRERRPDIKPLARLVARTFSGETTRFSPRALTALTAYRWPGNIRQLRNVVERATILARGDVVLPEHLPEEIRQARFEVDGADQDHFLPLDETRRLAIMEALKRCDGNRTRAAELLGISRRTLINRLKSYEQ